MSVHQNSLPPLWPPRRLWLKILIGLIYVPLLFDLLIWVLIPAAFLKGLYSALFFLLLIGGPISIGLLLAPSRRGRSRWAAYI